MKKIICIFVLILICFTPISKADNEETMKEQQEEFGITDFIKSAQEYTGEFFEEMDISTILDSALKGEVDNTSLGKRIFNLLGKEVVNGVRSILIILVIVMIHSILKSVSESLENENIAKLIYYVQYILIITVVMTNFSEIVTMVRDTCTNLVGFMNLLVPLLISLMLYTGSITTSGLLEPVILFMINFMGNIIQNLIIPFVLIFASLVIISKISDKVQIHKIANFLKSGIVWFLGIVLTIFVGMLSLEGTLSSSVDGLTAKATKAAVSNFIPVVGKVLGDSIDTVLGCASILKNAVGIVGVVVLIGICVVPIVKLAILTITYYLASAICQPIADSKIIKLLDQMGGTFKMLLAITVTVAIMFIIGITIVIKISNSGLMYR